MINIENISPAQLFIGNNEKLLEYTTDFLQKIFCKNNLCKRCSICRQIETHQHPGIIWTKPEKNYTKDQIQIIFDTIAFKLEPDQKVFFVIQNADYLSDVCSNSLLKSVEEPPAGYHFIFLAQRPDLILPTIKSRCVIKSFYKDGKEPLENQYENLCKIFTSNNYNANLFLKTLEETEFSEKDTPRLLDILLSHWLKECKSALIKKNKEKHFISIKKISVIKNSFEFLPMPGSNKIFWQNLFLQMQLN